MTTFYLVETYSMNPYEENAPCMGPYASFITFIREISKNNIKFQISKIFSV
jgi:hypothetical protein